MLSLRRILQPDPDGHLQRDLHRGAGAGAPLQVPARRPHLPAPGQGGQVDGGRHLHQTRHQYSGGQWGIAEIRGDQKTN